MRSRGDMAARKSSNPKSQIQNPKSKIENRKSQIENRKSKIENPKSQISNLKSQISNQISNQKATAHRKTNKQHRTISLIVVTSNRPVSPSQSHVQELERCKSGI